MMLLSYNPGGAGTASLQVVEVVEAEDDGRGGHAGWGGRGDRTSGKQINQILPHIHQLLPIRLRLNFD